jgi:hypothetical protein
MSTRRKNFTNKRSRPDWKQAAPRPLTPEARQRRTAWLTAHRLYLWQLLMREAEQ